MTLLRMRAVKFKSLEAFDCVSAVAAVLDESVLLFLVLSACAFACPARTQADTASSTTALGLIMTDTARRRGCRISRPRSRRSMQYRWPQCHGGDPSRARFDVTCRSGRTEAFPRPSRGPHTAWLHIRECPCRPVLR